MRWVTSQPQLGEPGYEMGNLSASVGETGCEMINTSYHTNFQIIIAERLSARQLILRRISAIVCMYICMYICMCHA